MFAFKTLKLRIWRLVTLGWNKWKSECPFQQTDLLSLTKPYTKYNSKYKLNETMLKLHPEKQQNNV